MTILPFYQVDTFTNQLFKGNPAGVVVLEDMIEETMMQSLATENNLPETAFVIKNGTHYAIRWFTPTVEVDLCGHATLATAFVLFEKGGIETDTIHFMSKSGHLSVRKDNEILLLNFPVDQLEKVELPETLEKGLGVTALETFRGRDDFMVLLENETDVASATPDMDLLSKIPSRGVIITAPAKSVDFVCRFFAPQSGIPEDPVTGSAYTSLIPYWSDRLGKTKLKSRQVSSRGGEVMCALLGDRVEIGGSAVMYLEGQITV